MDNYLSYRWPAPAPQGQKPRTPRKPKKKGRRVWIDILVIVLALALLGGAGVGAFYGVQYAAEQLAQSGGKPELPPLDPESPQPSQSSPTEEVTWTADLLPQAEHDPSVQLTLAHRADAELLTPAEIYKKVLPSMVAVYSIQGDSYGTGSGIVLSENGYILTNYHVVEGGMDLEIMLLSDRSACKAALVGYDKELDLAVLKAEGTGFIPAELGSSDELEVGDAVYAIGNPLGYLYGMMSDGMVSALGDRAAALDYPGRLIHTTAALNSGNSGGALVDSYGRVVGITYAKLTGIRGNVVVEGLGLVIPLSDAAPYIDRILRTGDSARPSLGIMCYSPITIDVDGEQVTGIQVAETTEGTSAHSKLLPNDLIIACNGVRVYVVDDMTRMLSEMDAGDEVELTVIRKGKEMTVSVELYDRLSELQ